MLSERQKQEIDRCRKKRYKSRDICRLVGCSEQELQDYISQQKMLATKDQANRDPDPTPEEIQAAVTVLREQQRRQPRYERGNERTPDNKRIPRHYCQVPRF